MNVKNKNFLSLLLCRESRLILNMKEKSGWLKNPSRKSKRNWLLLLQSPSPRDLSVLICPILYFSGHSHYEILLSRSSISQALTLGGQRQLVNTSAACSRHETEECDDHEALELPTVFQGMLKPR